MLTGAGRDFVVKIGRDETGSGAPAVLEPSERQQTGAMGRRYCDAEQKVTETYPHNPNGSPAGIAALCSPNGRHLAMMPHPERCFLMWQHPWFPADSGLQPDGPGPWLKMFQNANQWCRG